MCFCALQKGAVVIVWRDVRAVGKLRLKTLGEPPRKSSMRRRASGKATLSDSLRHRSLKIQAKSVRYPYRGSPACAGIDPRAAVGMAGSRRFPRMRGIDLRRRSLAPGRIGSPACAGIDPSAISTGKTHSRFPRMRGNRPPTKRKTSRGIGVPPHARDRPRLRRQLGAGYLGSPACAGIDPFHSPARSSGSRFPPMRGDRPWHDLPAEIEYLVPRMRGDRPSLQSSRLRPSGVPPHARG